MATSKTKLTVKAGKAKVPILPVPSKKLVQSAATKSLMKSVSSAAAKVVSAFTKSSAVKTVANKATTTSVKKVVPVQTVALAKKAAVKKKETKPAPSAPISKPKRVNAIGDKPANAARKSLGSSPLSKSKLKSPEGTPALVPPSTQKSSPPPMPLIKNSRADRVTAVSATHPTSVAAKSGRSMPEPNKARSSRSKHQDGSPAPTVLASNAAKASYGQFVASPQPSHPVPSATKKDPKLANNWKSKTADGMTDAEILAMPESEYMNPLQLQYFRAKLIQLRREILDSASETTEHLRDDSSVVPDPTDRATIEEEHALELRTRDRERKLLKKIDQSIARIDKGDYGFCDETGENIGTGRLLARPTATLSLEAQQRRELKQKLFGD
jgi:DnaK suppressor protein